MFNESIYAFQVYHVMNFLPYLSRKIKEWKNLLLSVKVCTRRKAKKSNQKLNLIGCVKAKGLWFLSWEQMSADERFLIEYFFR